MGSTRILRGCLAASPTADAIGTVFDAIGTVFDAIGTVLVPSTI